MTTSTAAARPPASPVRRVAAALYRRPRIQLAALLAAPIGWLVIAYLGSLALFFVSSFWSVDSLSGNIVTTPTLANYQRIASGEVYPIITARTVIMATVVTLTCIAVAFPIAFYMARVASPRVRGLLLVSILLPLWSGYLVKVYAWRLILSQNGVLNWVLAPFGLQGPGYSIEAVWIVESYLWLPYMIIPIYAGLDRIPGSLLEASADLGGRAGNTFRRVILPLTLPAVIAGAIFTFSLTLGDYITPTLVSNTKFIGNVVYDLVGVAGNQPLAAAYAMVPVTIMLVFLLVAQASRRLRGDLMGLPRWLRVALRLSTGLILAFIYLPIGIIVLYSFNAAKVATWPITSFTLDWYVKAFNDAGIRSSFATSVQVAIGATIMAIVLGIAAGLAVARFRFFGARRSRSS